MKRDVVRLYKILKDIDISTRLLLRAIAPHAHLQGPVKFIDNARLCFFIVRRKVVNAVLFEQHL